MGFGYPDITFGAYNGGTENDEESAIAVYEAMFAKEKVPELCHRLPNEILSRDEMKKNPPNILFTNYAMLEHLLLRPKDDVLFLNADFRFVVLDEAHIYTGATGIETSILLRRLKARISATKDTRFILTSATLGSDSSVDDDIITFAENLCGVSFDKKYIIRAEREPYVPNATIKKYPNELYEKLADGENFVWQVLNDYGLNVDKATDERELLYVTFVLVFFSDYWMTVFAYVIESTGVMLAVFGYAFAKQCTFVVKKSETGNLVVRVSDFSD